MTYILGISAFYHDSAAALIKDGEIISACQEERFTRIKHDPSFPSNAIKNIVSEENISLDQINNVVFYDKPLLKFERLLETYVSYAPKGLRSFNMAMPIWLKEKLFQKKFLIEKIQKHGHIENLSSKLFFSEHHLSHAASAFFPSPYEEALIITADGVGEWATTTIAIGEKNKIKIVKELNFPHSLGLLYSAFTYYTGFKVNSGEYKLMGLAPYGKPKYKDMILNNLIDVKEDGSFLLNQDYFNYATGLTMTTGKFEKLFGRKVRDAKKDNITNFHMDIAASIQEVTEEIILKICKFAKNKFKIENLCLAGGVALNCVANGKILKKKIFKNIWIQPAAGDAGGSLGAALALWYIEQNNPRKINLNDSMNGSYLGPEYNQNEIADELTNAGAIFDIISEDELLEKTAKDLSNGEAIGWFQGRMEFGPRALGGRSILGDPRSPEMQKNLNLKVKYRESFRPFAPSILKEDISEWFNISSESPYMLIVAEVNKDKCLKMTQEQEKLFGIDKLNIKRSDIPAVTHVDYSARIQTVNIETNPRYFKLISKFKKLTGCPILVNTSFNVRGEPIVNTPNDAFNCFMGTELDNLVIGNCYLEKIKQDQKLKKDYSLEFELD